LIYSNSSRNELMELIFVHRWWVWSKWSYCWVQDTQCIDEPDLVIASWLLHPAIWPCWC